MNTNQKTPLEPINASSSEFGVKYENQFIVLDDAKHVIGVDPKDARNLILENIENGKADRFRWRNSSHIYITSLVYDKKTESLYNGDGFDQLYKYRLDKTSKS